MQKCDSSTGGPHADWGEYQQLVLSELTRLSGDVKMIHEALTKFQKDNAALERDIKIELAILKVKAGVWGLMGGAIPIVIALAVHCWRW